MRLSILAGAILSLALHAAAAHAADPECDPLTHAAVGDGVTDNTAAIQSAIDACEATYGGGVVRLSAVPGKTVYLTGPILLANHIRLQLDKGVTLLGTADHTRFQIPSEDRFRAKEALVSAYQATDTGIIGPGIIDGQGGMPAADGGQSWWGPAEAATTEHSPRPYLVEFYGCTGVTVNDVTFRNAPMRNLVFRHSKGITVSELSINSPPDLRLADADGIDLIGSSEATLIFLDVASGGDSVALKPALPGAAERQAPTHDVQIVNSRFSGGNGIVVGSGVYNVMANNIQASRTAHALHIRPGDEYNIWLQNAALTDVRQPLMIGADGDAPAASRPMAAGIHDVTILNLTATGATQPSLIAGSPEACVRKVKLENVHIAGSSAAFQLRNVSGTFTNVTAALPPDVPPFVVQQNVAIASVSAALPMANGSSSPCD